MFISAKAKKWISTLLIIATCVGCCALLGNLTHGFQEWSASEIFAKERNEKNLLTLDYEALGLKSSNLGNGINVTYNEDGSIVLDGEATSAKQIALGTVTLSKGTYTLSGYDKAGQTTVYLTAATTASDTVWMGDVVGAMTQEVASGGTYTVYLNIANGAKFNNVKIFPVLNVGEEAVDFYK